MDSSAAAGLTGQLSAWAQHVLGGSAVLTELRPMPGNAGLSFGFGVESNGVHSRYVIRLAPRGVRREGNTDVLRQVPLLAALDACRVPVARLVWSSSDESWFGTDAIVQEWIAGAPLHLYDSELSVAAQDVPRLAAQAIEMLARMHQVPWRQYLPGWQPRPVATEIGFWLPLMRKAAEAPILTAAVDLAEALMAAQPPGMPGGLTHGDFQTNNVLYAEDGRLLAVIDWELAGVGAQLLDLGWLSMMTDPSAWDPGHAKRLRVRAEPEWVRDTYASASGRPVEKFDWYRALACYRFACIAAFNLRLHRTGRRVDPWYEELASSIPALLRRGSELAARSRSSSSSSA
jgi:aminoglycoside phosphotransferase (APT) family kinase protein